MGMNKWLRPTVEQYTNAELRQRVRFSHGLALLHPHEAKAWRMMAYGVLLDRRTPPHDRVAETPEQP